MLKEIKHRNILSWKRRFFVFAFVVFAFLSLSASATEASFWGNSSKPTAADFNLAVSSGPVDFQLNQSPELNLKFSKKRNMLASFGAMIKSLFVDEYKNIEIAPSLVGAIDGKIVPGISLKAVYQKDGKFSVSLSGEPREMKPGKYRVNVGVSDANLTGGEVINLSQDFSWGVLAFNSNKSIYSSREAGYLQMAVLDDEGHTICDADVSLSIVAPDGKETTLSTANKQIMRNSACGPDNVIKTPDYSAFYSMDKVGEYKVTMNATTKNGPRSISDHFEVRDSVPFDIERFGPTRVFPKADYQMKVKIKANENYSGDIVDVVPASFKILDAKYKTANQKDLELGTWNLELAGNEQKIVWKNVGLAKGEEAILTYLVDFPDISPDFYLIGPLSVGNFSETRKWQIASDALSTDRVKTVEFLAGTYSSNGTTGQNSNTNQSFATFNFSLAETGVSIKNAFVVFESQYTAYTANVAYTGYVMNFDSCQGACTSNAYTGANRVTVTDATNLNYSEAESDVAKILVDVTSEGELAAYTGGGVNMNAQVGYRLNQAAAANSIANAKAKLVITYTYDRSSPNVTNTVVYPLEAAGVGNSGTKSTSTATNCVFGSSCPTFAYNMDIPEFSTASGSVQKSQWFQMYNQTQSSVTNDVTSQLKIGSNATSSDFVYEESLSGQSNMPEQYFGGLAGFSENTSQTVGYRLAATAGTFFLQGGEVSETYTASSSAAVKTRTVSFPVGVINNGNSTASSSRLVNVYFPENGPTATGTVTIKKAWLRLITNNTSAAAYSMNVVTKTGANASSTSVIYNYNPSAMVVKPAFNIIHVIPSSDYNELASANAASPKTVNIATQNSATNQGGLSGELMITYTYTDESNGYLDSVKLFAGQSLTAPNTRSTITPTANMILPETVGKKTIRSGSILASYLFSDSSGNVRVNNLTYDANISTGTPTCTNSHLMVNTSGVNEFTEFYKDVTSALTTTNNQSYNACYSNANSSNRTQEGAKMNGILTYTYQFDNTAPTSTIGSVVEKTDGSGGVHFAISVNDQDQDTLRAKIEYATGTACLFSPSYDPTLDETPANITASSGTVIIDNASPYQVGTSTGWISTTGGENNVQFDWLSKTDISNATGTYCVRLTANDGYADQLAPATSTVYIDNRAPVLSSAAVPNLPYKIGDTVRATLTLEYDTDSYTLEPSSINTATSATSNLVKVNNTTYTVDYVVTAGDPDRATGTIPYEVILKDPYGNISTTTGTFANGRIDANAPDVTAATIPDIVYKIGDVLTATITVSADTDAYSMASSSINNATSTTSNLRKINNTTYLIDHTINEGEGDAASGTIPYVLVLKDFYGNISTTTGTFANGRIDATRPVVSSVTIANGAYKIGSAVAVTIFSDGTGYTAGAITVNGKDVSGTFASAGGNNYSVTYNVAQGDSDRTTGNIPVSIVLVDPAGNQGSPAFTSPSANTASVDANPPSIVSVVIPNGAYKVGDVIRATTTVVDDAILNDTYTLGVTTINNVNVSNLVKVNSTTYTFDYTIVNGNADRLLTGTIPYSVILTDSAGQSNSPAFAGDFPNGTIDANKPAITNVTFYPSSGLLKIGDTAHATITVTADTDTYTAVTAKINNVNVSIQKVSNTTYAADYTVQSGDQDRADSGDLPVYFVFADSFGNQSDVYNTADPSGRPGIDANRPVITAIDVDNLAYKVGDLMRATITVASDVDTYATTSATLNGINVTNLQKINDTTYTVDYVIVEGNTDRATGTIPYNIVLHDTAGNDNSPAFTGNLVNGSIDAHAPVVTDYQIPNISYKIGDTITATVTVTADADIYTVSSSTINDVPTTNLQKINDTTYTVDHVVGAGEADHANGQIPFHLVFMDKQGNLNSPYSGNSGGSIDANAPVISNVTFNPSGGVMKIGDTATATIFADGANYSAVTATINGKDVAGTLASAGGNNYSVTYTVQAGDNDIVDIADLPVYFVLSDQAGNQSTAYNISDAAGRPGVDAHAPVVTDYQIPNISYKIGDTITATVTVTADADIYTVSSSTINDVPTTNLQKINNTTYTVDHVVGSGETDRTNGNIPFHLVFADTAGNLSAATTSVSGGSIDAHSPIITNFQIPITNFKIGDTITATITVSSDVDTYTISSSTINNIPTINLQKVSNTTYTVDHIVGSGETDRTNGTIPFHLVFSDTAGNLSAATTSVSGGSIDAHAPTAPGPLSFAHHTKNSITLNLGATTTESNFVEYKIFYKVGATGVTESDTPWTQANDANLGNINYNGATTTTITGLSIGTQYVFNIWAYDLAGNKTSATEFSASTNGVPYNQTAVGQYRNDGVTAIANGGWTLENSVKLKASANDPDANEIIALYFEFIPNGSTFTTATSEPTGACTYGTAYGSCGTKVWFVASSSPADYSVTPFTDTVNITSIPDSAAGYKWQIIACDTGGDCSAWQKFNAATPNLKVDNTPPTPPGNLTVTKKTSTSVTLAFGATTTESNFAEYRIYYKEAASGVTENDQLHGSSTDANLGYINFNGKSTTTIDNLTASTTYFFNIWAYDLAGNKAYATEVSTTTSAASNPPTGNFNSAALKTNGSGSVDISMNVDDLDNDDLRVRIDYVAGTGCNFSTPLDPTLDENAANISALNGTVMIDNASVYQVGTSTGMIQTNAGQNTVGFDWLSKTNVPTANGYYCLRMTANDGAHDQVTPATTTVYVDNLAPTAPGNLTLADKRTNAVDLSFGATSSDTNFSHYKIFYKQGSSGVTESDTELADGNLSNVNYNGAATTTISGLAAGTQYVVNIWAYDSYGNKASATELSFTTNSIPTPPASLGQFKNDGVTAISNGGWTKENNVKLKASVNDSDNPETLSLYFELIPNGSSFTTSTSAPAGACASNASYGSCGSHIWAATSSAGDYSLTPFTGTVNPTSIPDSATGYKWQVLACDAEGACSSWSSFGAGPDFKVDTVVPTTPGNLTLNSRTSTSVTLNFGATTTESNFIEYRIYYKQAASGVTENDSLHSSTTDANLANINYNGAGLTIISGLTPGLPYVFNIWAYDAAGNKASATELSVTTNVRPTGSFVSAAEKTDGSGSVDISMQVSDSNGDNSRAKIEYVAGGACDFTSPNKATIDMTVGAATSSYGTISIDNASTYQVGTSTGMIQTNSGANTVNFDWLSKTDAPAANGVYCLRLTVNDGMDDQLTAATTTVTIDNVDPTAPGDLTLYSKTASKLTLSYGATTTETNFKEYKIYWRQGAGTVTESDTPLVDANLSNINYNGAATTSLSSLSADTQYSFKIFAYDNFGNKSSSNQVTYKTNAHPIGTINSLAEKTDGSGTVDVSIQVYDVDGDNVRAKIEYVDGAACNFASPLDPTLDTNPTNISATYGSVVIDNASAYQVGTSSGWITTNSGANTVNFDWLSKMDAPAADGIYCLRLTANDNLDDQLVLATSTVYIDNVKPTAPGALTFAGESSISVTLNFGASTTETNFTEYKIFYKQGASGVTEQDMEKNQYDDPNLAYKNYNGAATTTISGLIPSTQYVFNIWAYDAYGNKASSTTEFSTTTMGIEPATWREAEDTADPTLGTALGKEHPVRLRMAMANTGDWQVDNNTYRIQYADKGTSTCAGISNWSNIPVFATTEHFEMIDSVYFESGASTSQRFANSEGYTFTPGYMIDRPDYITGPQSIGGNGVTEIEYAIQPTRQSKGGHTYCFRTMNASTTVDSYDIYPELTIAPPPVASFASAEQKADGSGIVDVAMTVTDPNGAKARAKIEYVAGADCNFASPAKPTLDQTQANISSTFGTVYIDNASEYQIGTTTNHMIPTQYGPNTVNFDWPTKTDLTNADGVYCLRATANDTIDDQPYPATTTVTIDHVAPTVPGDLSSAEITSNSATLLFGTSSTDTNFKEYKIFYKEGSSGVTESDTLWGSSSDPNLGYANFNNASSTTVTGLQVNRQYVFKIWAYDRYGNKSNSSGEVVVIIKSKAKSQNWQFYFDRQNETPTSSAAAENTAPSNVVAGNVFKLRLTLKEIEGIDSNGYKVRLQYSTYSDFSQNVNFVEEMSSTTAIWTYGDGVDTDNATVTTLILGDSDIAGTHNESGISSSSYVLLGNSAPEFEFTIRNNGAPVSTTYYFRAYDTFNNEAVIKNGTSTYPSLVTEAPAMSYVTAGLSSGVITEGATTNISSTAQNINFGTLNFSTTAIAAQRFTINTNSGQGYHLYVYETQDFLSNIGSIIEPIAGTNENPIAWPASPYPSGFGYHAGDDTLSGVFPSRFAPNDSYAKFETSMKEISYSPVPVANKQVDLVVKLEVTNQQSAGDYTTDMVYVIVPTY